MHDCLGIINATILTLDRQDTVTQALLIEGDRIAALGSSEAIQERCQTNGYPVLDLSGNTVVPGFHDAHVHMMMTGINQSGLDLYNCASIDEVLQVVRQAAQDFPEERWIYGKRLDESRLAEKRPPTATELDRVAPKHAVYLLDRGLHYTLINSRAFDLLSIPADAPGVRRGSGGEATGRLHEKANTLAKKAFSARQDRATREEALWQTARLCAQAGVTTAHAVEGGELFADADIPVILDLQKELPVRVVLYWSTEDLNKIQAASLPRMGGDILLDGSIGSRTAAFAEVYADDPATCGTLYYSDDRVEELITNAHLAGVQISFHVIGELAITQALDCFERVLARYPRADHRHRLEHFGFPRPGETERAARLGLVISTQPAFTYLRGGPGSVYNERLGNERERGGYPISRMLGAGITIAGGSDSDVTPINPIIGIHAAVNPPYPEHAISTENALRIFTIDAAKAAFEEKEKGSLETGKLADLTVLDQNPLTFPPDKLKEIEVVMTIKGGKIVYQKRIPNL